MIQCPKCGKVCEDGTKFCPDCGTKLPEPVTPEQDTNQYTYGQPGGEQNMYGQPNSGQNTYGQPNDGQYSYQQYYDPNAGMNAGMNPDRNSGMNPGSMPNGSNGSVTAALICGITSIPCGLIPILGLTLGILGIVLGVSGKKKCAKKNFGTAGMICGIIGIIVSVIVWIVSFSVIFSSISEPVTTNQPSSGITAESPDINDGNSSSGSSDNSGSSSGEAFDSRSLTYIKKMPTISQTVLVDENGLRITATGIEQADYGEGVRIDLLIENNTANDLIVSTESMSVNNYMMDGTMYSSVVSGKKSNDYLLLDCTDLNASEITNIGEIDIDFYVMDSNSYDSVILTAVPLQTSDYAAMDSKAISSGQEILNQDGLRIVALQADSDDYDVNVYYYIENTMGSDITISTEDTSVNGYMLDGSMYTTIKNGKKAVTAMKISKDDLTANNITSVDEFEVTFDVRDNNTYDELGTIGPIKFTINDKDEF